MDPVLSKGVGALAMTTLGNLGEGIITIPLMGNTPSNEFTGYLEFGDVPEIVIFDNSENFDYATLMKRAQALYTTRMTDIIDEKIINFYDTNKNTAKSLSKIIRAKQKFPKEQFSKLKNKNFSENLVFKI